MEQIGRNNILINHILLLFKKFLYHKRNEPNRLHITTLMHYIKSVEKIEQKIANEKSKLATLLHEPYLWFLSSFFKPTGKGGTVQGGGRCGFGYFYVVFVICVFVYCGR